MPATGGEKRPKTMRKAAANPLKHRLAAARSRGLTLIETALTLAIMALVVASLATMMAENADQVRARAAADKITEVYEAAQGYIKANYGALLSQTASGPVVIPAGRPSAADAVPNPSLQRAGFLSPGFVDSNGYGQHHSLVVRRVDGSTTALEAIVTTHGGRPIPDRQLGRIATMIGAMGGYVPEVPVDPTDANRVIGAYGGWRTDRTGWGSVSPTPGTVQATLAFEDGQLLTDYLYRNDIGIPEANRMNTDIDMNGNEIDNLAAIRAAGGNLSIFGNARVEGSLEASEDVVASRNVIAGTGDVIAESGDMIAEEGSVRAGYDVTADRDLVSGRNLRVNGNAEIVGSGTIQGDLGVAGKTTTGDFKTSFMDGNTVIYGIKGLSKGSNVTLDDLLPTYVPQYSYRVTPTNNLVPKPSCGGNSSRARIMIYNQMQSVLAPSKVTINSDGSVRGETYIVQGVKAVNVGLTWRVEWVGMPPANPANDARQVIAQTFCFYG